MTTRRKRNEKPLKIDSSKEPPVLEQDPRGGTIPSKSQSQTCCTCAACWMGSFQLRSSPASSHFVPSIHRVLCNSFKKRAQLCFFSETHAVGCRLRSKLADSKLHNWLEEMRRKLLKPSNSSKTTDTPSDDGYCSF